MKNGMGIRGFIALLGAMAVAMLLPTTGFSEVPQQINYQGSLTDDLDNPLTGNYVMVFSIYDVSSGGIAQWWEQQTVSVTDGVYNVQVGQDPVGNPFPEDLFDGQRWFGVAVESDPEMTPRQLLTAVPFTLKAADSETLSGQSATDFAGADHGHAFDEITGSATDSQVPDTITINHASAADNADTVDGQHASAFAPTAHTHSGTDITTGTVADPRIVSTITRDSEVMNIVTNSDGPGSGLNADLLDGLSSESFLSNTSDYGRSGVATNLYEGSSTLTSRYVNVTGDTMSGSASGGLLSATNTNAGGSGIAGYCYATDGSGVFGQGASKGIYGYSNTSGSVSGVYGEATNPGYYMNYGGYFAADGKYGRGVVGEATATTHTNHGGYFKASGASGRGVMGEALGATGRGVFGYAANTGNVTNYGGYFTADGATGRGVYGVSSNDSGRNYGGYFEASGYDGRGVYGKGQNRGGYFIASGPTGQAVYGQAVDTGGDVNYGGYFVSDSDFGIGLYGYGTHGVVGETNGNGYAAAFNGPVHIDGTLTAITKYFVQPHKSDPTKEIVYVSMEGPEHAVFIRGTATLEDGVAYIEMPEYWTQVAADEGITVNLTPEGLWAPLFVASKSKEEIVVQVAEGGPLDAAFSYTVMAPRDGFQDHEPIQENTKFTADRDSAWEFKNRYKADTLGNMAIREMLMTNGILNPDGSLNVQTAERLGWKITPNEDDTHYRQAHGLEPLGDNPSPMAERPRPVHTPPEP